VNGGTLAAPLKPADAAGREKAHETYGNLPLSFEMNRGQVDPAIQYFARGFNYGFFLTATERKFQCCT
jgi:hypothetical protein